LKTHETSTSSGSGLNRWGAGHINKIYFIVLVFQLVNAVNLWPTCCVISLWKFTLECTIPELRGFYKTCHRKFAFNNVKIVLHKCVFRLAVIVPHCA